MESGSFHTINKRYVLEFRNRTGNIRAYYVKAVERCCGVADKCGRVFEVAWVSRPYRRVSVL